jgi:hypothetical protein
MTKAKATPATVDPEYLVLFHVEDPAGHPIASAAAASTGGPGPWQSMTNPCGDVVNPATGLAGVLLRAGDYTIVFSAAGYADRTLPVHIATEGPPIRVGLERAAGGGTGPLPPIPTRALVCSVQHSLAGLTYPTRQYGPVPAWFYGKLEADDRAAARAAHRAAGDTHIPIPITEAYREGGTLWPAELADGYDYTNDLDTYRAIAHEAIADGFFIDCPLGGDGLGNGPGYNDPVGRTYGRREGAGAALGEDARRATGARQEIRRAVPPGAPGRLSRDRAHAGEYSVRRRRRRLRARWADDHLRHDHGRVQHLPRGFVLADRRADAR